MIKLFCQYNIGWDLNCKTQAFIPRSEPWVVRGGNYNNASNAGVFAFNYVNGGSNTNWSFRSVLSAAKLWLKSSKIMFKSKQVIRFLTRHLYYNPLKFSSNLDIRVNINRENLTGRKRIYRYSPGVTLFLMSNSKNKSCFL